MLRRAKSRNHFPLILVATLLFSPAYAETNFRIYGTLSDTTGRPAGGFRLIFHDTITNKDIEAPPTDRKGSFGILVPHRTFTLVSVLGPSGETYVFRNPAIITDGSAGVQVSVRLVRVPILGAAGPESSVIAEATVGGGGTSTPIAEATTPKKTGPWYRKPGSVTGFVLGSVTVAVLAFGGGSDAAASPYYP